MNNIRKRQHFYVEEKNLKIRYNNDDCVVLAK